MRQASFAILGLVMLVSLLGISNSPAYAEESQESSERKFLVDEIYHSFDVSEPYVSYGEYNYMIVDIESMRADRIADLDIEIMTKWAALSNMLVKAMMSNDRAEVSRILDDAETGQFGLFFNPPQ
ncbi:MAG: hypothetical protein EB829_04350 [Nitrosopumilus sp. H8]|nr:MAG: hypothetical protein EB829_04350 [Nitrosopumilus sp. H8]